MDITDVGFGQLLLYSGICPVTRLSLAGAEGEKVVVLLCSPDCSEEKALAAILPCILS